MEQQVRVDYFRYIKHPRKQLYNLKQFPCRYYRKRGFKSVGDKSLSPATKGGMTVAYVDINGTMYQTTAMCHPRLDNFSYRIGRAIATGRLYKLLRNCIDAGELSSEQVENVVW